MKTTIIFVENIKIQITRKKIKNIYLKVKPPEGEIVISAPLKTSDDFIKNFINLKLDWLKTTQAKIQKKSLEKQKHRLLTGEKLKLWDNEYILNIIYSNSNKLELDGNVLNFYVTENISEVQKINLIKNWYKKEMHLKVSELLPKWESIMNLHVNSFSIKLMKTRWGSCNNPKKKISLNLSLAERPVKYLEYIIVHELSHLKIKNHQKDFWDLVDSYIENSKKIRKELNTSLKTGSFLDVM